MVKLILRFSSCTFWIPDTIQETPFLSSYVVIYSQRGKLFARYFMKKDVHHGRHF